MRLLIVMILIAVIVPSLMGPSCCFSSSPVYLFIMNSAALPNHKSHPLRVHGLHLYCRMLDWFIRW